MLNNMELQYLVPMMVFWGTEVLCTKDCSDVLFFHTKVLCTKDCVHFIIIIDFLRI
jgi:hypothetical protein